MKYVMPALLLVCALVGCSQSSDTVNKTASDTASVAKSANYQLSAGEKVLVQAVLAEDLKNYFAQSSKKTAFAEDQPLIDADKLAADYRADKAKAAQQYAGDTFGVIGKIGVVRLDQGKTVVEFKTKGQGAAPHAYLSAGTSVEKVDLKPGSEVKMICRGQPSSDGVPVLRDCLVENEFKQSFSEKVFAAIEQGRTNNGHDATAEEAMARKFKPFVAAAKDFTGDFKACKLTLTEFCVGRLARVMPEKNVQAKAREMGLQQSAPGK